MCIGLGHGLIKLKSFTCFFYKHNELAFVIVGNGLNQIGGDCWVCYILNKISLNFSKY